MCTLCAFDIAEEVARIFAGDEPAKGGWKTQVKPAVTSFAWASPRVGNYTFLKVGWHLSCLNCCCQLVQCGRSWCGQ